MAWTTCSSGKQLALGLHDGEHAPPDGWSDDALPWAGALPR